MRKIEEEALRAFEMGCSFHKNNTAILGDNYYLHDNKIAWYEYNQGARYMRISSCGWYTSTTKSRLNSILSNTNYKVIQHKWDWFLVNTETGHTVPFYDGIIVD